MPPLKEEVDFYYDNGLMVLTEAFHRQRGFCCGNGCRHCPYDYINVREPKRSELLALRKTHEQGEKDS